MALTREERDDYRRQLIKTDHAISVWANRYPEHAELLQMSSIARELLNLNRSLLDIMDEGDAENPNPQPGDIDDEWRKMSDAA
jgi:hypothetical protein